MENKASAVITLHELGKKPCEILKELKGLKVNRMFIFRNIKRFVESGSTQKRYGGGRKPTATRPENIRKVRDRLRRNPRRSARKMAEDIGISKSSMGRILKLKLKTKPFKIQKVQELNDKQKKIRLERSKELKRRCAAGELPNIVFSDEKIFTVEQFVNKQNDRIWTRNKRSINPDHFRSTRRQGAASVMVWAAITETGRTPLVFVPEGVKINAQTYQELILEGCLKPWAESHFGNTPWVFQQDSAPAHKAKATQNWLVANIPKFISTLEWPPYSPDINPMDFSIWSILENKVCSTRQPTLESLKRHLQREWEQIPQETLRAACINFQKRLSLLIRERGGLIEN